MKAYPYMHKHPTSGQTTESEGMDLRDWFAGLAMQAMISEPSLTATMDEFAAKAYQMADLMMKQRKEVPNE